MPKKNRNGFLVDERIPTNFRFKDNPEITVMDLAMLATRDFAIVELEARVGNVEVRSQGSSKRFMGTKKIKGDKPNKDIGLGLALSRALASLSKKVERQALGLSAHDENMRKLKKAKTKKN